MRTKRLFLLCSAVGLCLVGPPAALGGSVTVSWALTTTSPEYGTRSAKVDFTMVDNDLGDDYLKITLRNMPASDPVEVPEQVLTGVFFDLVEEVSLDPWYVEVPAGSTVIGPEIPYDGPPHVGPGGPLDVSGEYGFRDDLTISEDHIEDYPDGLGRTAVSAVGMEDAIGRWDVFSTDPQYAYWPPEAPDGMAFGLVSELAGTANNPLDDLPLVRDTVEFYLNVDGGVPENYELGVEKVGFNYGTDFNPHIIPLPSASLLGGAALGGMGLVGWCKRRRGLEAAA